MFWVPGKEMKEESHYHSSRSIPWRQLIAFVAFVVMICVYYIINTYYTEMKNEVIMFFKYSLWGLWWALDMHGIDIGEEIKVLAGAGLYTTFIYYVLGAIKRGAIIDAMTSTGRFFATLMVGNTAIFVAAALHILFF